MPTVAADRRVARSLVPGLASRAGAGLASRRSGGSVLVPPHWDAESPAQTRAPPWWAGSRHRTRGGPKALGVARGLHP